MLFFLYVSFWESRKGVQTILRDILKPSDFFPNGCDPIRNWPISGNLDIKGLLESPKVLGWFGNIIKAHLSAASNDEIAGFFEGSEKAA